MMGHPSEKTLKNMVSNDVIQDCDITPTDLANANAIYGPDRASLRGKSVRRQPSKVHPEFIKIPQSLFEKLREVVLVAEVMFVNGLSLFVTESRKIGLLTVDSRILAFPNCRFSAQLSHQSSQVLQENWFFGQDVPYGHGV
jgi:hypothetical protein